MTYNDIKQRVYDLLWPITEAEARRIGYSDKIHRIFNEATFRVAHAILPNVRVYKIKLSADKLPAQISMPPDFISFCEEQNAYVNGRNFVLTRFVGYNNVILGGEFSEPYNHEIDCYCADEELKNKRVKEFEYHIYYNALYPEVVDGGKNFKFLKIPDDPVLNSDNYEYERIPTEQIHNNTQESYQLPELIGHIIPHFIVSQLLSLDDKVRSIEELNTFETLLATVNVDRNERQREYHSVRGWY